MHDYVLITTAPHNFAGAATAHCRTIEMLARRGWPAVFVGFNQPFRTQEFLDAGVELLVPSFRSDAYPSSDAVQVAVVGQAILERAKRAIGRGGIPVLVGTYLFPFCQAVAAASRVLTAERVQHASIAIPAGSDVWQVGARVRDVCRELLSSPNFSSRVVYSKSFVSELKNWIGDCGAFSVIPPPIDTTRFRPPNSEQRTMARSALGISRKDFVLLNCSNMRPVKGLPAVLQIAQEVARNATWPTWLLLVGPLTEHLRLALRRLGSPEVPDPPAEITFGKLCIKLIGLQLDVRPFNWAADIALNASLHDSFNISLAESMACAVPIISTNVAGIFEDTSDSQVGFLFAYEVDDLSTLLEPGHDSTPGFDVEKVSRAALDLLEDLHLRKIIGEVARELVEIRFAAPVVATKWETLLAESSRF